MLNTNRLSYDEIFDRYVAALGNSSRGAILPLLKISRASTPLRLEIIVPELWELEITKTVLNISQMYGELRTRIADSDVILPNLVGNLGSPHRRSVVAWPNETVDLINSSEDIKVNKRLEFHPAFIELNVNVSDYISRTEGLQPIIDHMLYDIARLIDESVISPVSYMKNNPIESILTSEDVFDHESSGMQGVAGYIDNTDIDLKTFNPETIKNTLLHMPRAYRQRAKWIMNSETALALEDMRFQVNNVDSDIANNWSPLVNQRLLGRPVILNEFMPSKGLIIILADLTRGYQISRHFQNMHLIVTPNSVGLKFKVAGKVIQPAAFKGIRCNYAYEIPEVDYDSVKIQTEYDEDGKEIFY